MLSAEGKKFQSRTEYQTKVQMVKLRHLKNWTKSKGCVSKRKKLSPERGEI